MSEEINFKEVLMRTFSVLFSYFLFVFYTFGWGWLWKEEQKIISIVLFLLGTFIFYKFSIKFQGVRRPIREERERLQKILEIVDKQKKDYSIDLSKYNFYIEDDQTDINAYAIGADNIVLNTCTLSQDEKIVVGIILHEIAHLKYKDTLTGSFSFFGETVFVLIFKFSRIFQGLLILFILPLIFIRIIGSYIFLFFNKIKEYRCDKYSFENGGGEGLLMFFDIYRKYQTKQSFFEKLKNSHPISTDRIIHLENLMDKIKN